MGGFYERFLAFSAEVHNKPPRTWLDIVARAELAGHHVLWKLPRDDWHAVSKCFNEEVCDEDRASAALALAILWLAARQDGQATAASHTAVAEPLA